MSTLGRFWSATKRTAAKVADKAGELADSAAVTLKIKSLEMRMEEEYAKLGELVYRDLHTEEDLEEEKLVTIATIDGLFDRLTVLKESKNAAEEPAEESAKETTEETAEAVSPEEDTIAEPKEPTDET